MSDAIRPPMGNSLSPEPCALCPEPRSFRPSMTVTVPRANRRPVDNSRPSPLTVMDGASRRGLR